MLASSLGLVEDIVSDSADIARAVTGERVTPRPAQAGRRDAAQPPAIIGWQDVRLALNAVCADCNGILPRGVAAAVAVYGHPGPQTIVCTTCRDRRLQPDAAEPEKG